MGMELLSFFFAHFLIDIQTKVEEGELTLNDSTMLWSSSTMSKSSFAACRGRERARARSEQTETRAASPERLAAQVRVFGGHQLRHDAPAAVLRTVCCFVLT